MSLAEVVNFTLQQIVPETTPPGAIQLDVGPANAKLVSVPLLLFPLASVKLVTTALLPEGMPWLK